MTAVCAPRIGLQRHRAAQGAAINGRATASTRRILMSSGVISTASWAGSLAAKTAVVVVGLETVEVLGDSNPI